MNCYPVDGGPDQDAVSSGHVHGSAADSPTTAGSTAKRIPWEMTANTRFEFGHNWTKYLESLDEPRIRQAEESVRALLRRDTLEDTRFLDAGSGSGLFSLAARRLGAEITSFDLDAESVACTQRLKEAAGAADEHWCILRGSVLDREFLGKLGEFDIVYSWGVLHHTGQMWEGLQNLALRVTSDGLLVIAIYNDQGFPSRVWHVIKRTYHRLPRFLRPLFVIGVWAWGFFCRVTVTLVAMLIRLITLHNPLTPLTNWIRDRRPRGMHAWYDLVDWVGGWPFEVARPCEVFCFLRDRGFELTELVTTPGHGCNEYVFHRRDLQPGLAARAV